MSWPLWAPISHELAREQSSAPRTPRRITQRSVGVIDRRSRARVAILSDADRLDQKRKPQLRRGSITREVVDSRSVGGVATEHIETAG